MEYIYNDVTVCAGSVFIEDKTLQTLEEFQKFCDKYNYEIILWNGARI